MTPNHSTLAEAFDNLRRSPFPPAPNSESLADLHATLAGYDGHVAGYVSQLLSGDINELPKHLVNHELEKALAIAVEVAEKEATAAKRLLEYYNGLVEVLKTAGIA